MIPILIDRFDGSGETVIGTLDECISCTVTEERNGIYVCEFLYPVTGQWYSYIQEGETIKASHDETGDTQYFDIVGRSAPIDGQVTFYADHISYRLNGVTVAPFTAGSAAQAINYIKTKSINTNIFSFTTSLGTVATMTVDVPSLARGLLGGEEGSILDTYGGEYEFNNLQVNLRANRGTDSGVEIRYGKNLVDITQDIDIGGGYDAVVPFWFQDGEDGSTLVTLPEQVVTYDGADTGYTLLADEDWDILQTQNSVDIEVDGAGSLRVVPLDLSGEFEEQPTEAQLRASAKSHLTRSKAWIPDENVTVDFVQLWQTDEYAEYAPLQRVRLCDTVSVFYPELGVIKVKQKVIKTVWNVLLERYDSIELGKLRSTLGDTIRDSIDIDLTGYATMSDLSGMETIIQEAIDNATELITGGQGGYVYIKPNANGQPEEILIMNTNNVNTATKLWRWNLNGLGYSSSGYSGTYGTAITMDGAIVADYITAGTLNANIIKAGVLSAGNGVTTLDLSTGKLTMTKGSISIGSTFSVSEAGALSATSGTIGPFTIGSTGLSVSGTKYGNFYYTANLNYTGIELENNGPSYSSGTFTNKARLSPAALTVTSSSYTSGVNSDNISSAGSSYMSWIRADGTVEITTSGQSGYFFRANTSGLYSRAGSSSGSSFNLEFTSSGLTIRNGSVTRLRLQDGSFLAYMGSTTVSSVPNVYASSAHQFQKTTWSPSSSRKLKKNITTQFCDDLDPAKLYDIDVVQFEYNDLYEEKFNPDPNDTRYREKLLGVLIEDLDEVWPLAVDKPLDTKDDETTWTRNDVHLIPPMLKLIQDQKHEIDELRSEIEELKSTVKALTNRSET